MTLVSQFHTYGRSHAEVLFYVCCRRTCIHCSYEEKIYITKYMIGELIILEDQVHMIMIHVYTCAKSSFPHFEEGVRAAPYLTCPS